MFFEICDFFKYSVLYNLNMKKRVFIAVNLPDYLKKKLVEFQVKWADLPFRWTGESNLHLTLVFVGYVTDDQLFEICKITRQTAKTQEPFEIKFSRICYGPPASPNPPEWRRGEPGKPARMVWLQGEASPALAGLKGRLEEFLFQSGDSGYFEKENRPLKPHITLGRLKLGHRASELPLLDEKVDYGFFVESIEVMESTLKRGGAEYTILESVPLGK